MNYELALDLLLIVLLLATIIYVALLQRRLSSLRADREAVDTVVDRMNEATRRAEASLKGIRQTAEQARATLDDPMTRAQALRDELSFLVQRADAAGERVANGLSSSGGSAPAAAAPRPRPAAKGGKASTERAAGGGDRRSEEPADDVRSQAERDLMDALRNVR
ncbi:DUF6468 domain-containing protein [Thalassobaculum sp.]|uniref:DUF6468 domain-containing protein n=1 Tax=Thalassobaculum sp. TaxID=2022740 RepID=UPI0032EEBD1A